MNGTPGKWILWGMNLSCRMGFECGSGERRRGELAGYDRDVYVEVDFQGEDDQRSFLWEVVSKHVNKIVNIPNIKDHASAGATGCLKNIGYGSFSNVARSHSLKTPVTHTRTFIGTLNTVEPLRSRTVLHIMDGLRGVWHGGPAAFTPKFLWYPKLLQFGTDPVAMDRIELDIVDGKRKEMGAVSIFNRDPQFLGRTRVNPARDGSVPGTGARAIRRGTRVGCGRSHGNSVQEIECLSKPCLKPGRRTG